MDLTREIEKCEKFLKICEFIQNGNYNFKIGGGNLSFYSYLLSSLFKKLNTSFLIIFSDEKNILDFCQNISVFLPEDKIKFLPSPEFSHSGEISEIMFERVKKLVEISSERRTFVITSILSVVKKIPSFETLSSSIISVKKGDYIKREEFIRKLIDFGYDEVEVVEIPGEFARRGGIVDVFPLNQVFPLRFEFLGNRINSIRKFDVSTQSSFEKIESFSIYPLNEYYAGEEEKFLFSEMKEKITFFFDPEKVRESYFLNEILKNEKKHYQVSRKILEDINNNSIKIGKIYNPKRDIYFSVFPVFQRFKIGEKFIWESYEGERIVIFSDNVSQTQRIKEILKKEGIDISEIKFYEGTLSSGFSFPEINLTFLSNDEIFSRYRKRHIPFRKIESIPVSSWDEIKKGDYVVHYNEGIGKFVDMKRLKMGDKEEEFIVLEYEGGDKLYVPISQISFIHKYVGDKKPKLSKLGSKNWIKIKEKVKNSIRDLATDLYNLYIERKKEKGFKFAPDDQLQKEFEDSFIYQETEDQLKAIKEVKNDMMSEKIMDRIVCGDAGYGKTEVAMRASFKSVLSGKQVIVLVPTTVLALQHYLTFKERFADFPVIIEMLSRMVPNRKIKEILKNLKEGKIDIIIGTHRLLQDDVEIKNPGLLIIDEEQRFGVVHKEKIKAIFRKIDVLTLTATPIPRTLNMALSGLKDISLIETPPAGRLSVITYIGRYNERIVKEAILREIERGGQVFYLHNFIYDIEKIREKLKNLIPGIKIEVSHGRMKPEELQNVMGRFSSGKIDVLVATTIVENGIDIPAANTLIVDNAHRYGLADLYQLRGRVGRYKWRAYAYFLIPHHIPLDKKTKERLKALQELNNPGSGYKIALRDLEIRGAGNILGKEQHGFIDMVGFHLYCQFWKEIMGEIKNEKVIYEPEEVKIDRFIPYDYIKTPSLRLWLYSKIAQIKNKKEAEELIYELKDRFGFIPSSLESKLLQKIGKHKIRRDNLTR